MPNLCSNTIVIDGEKAQLDILKEKLNKIILEDKYIMNTLLFDQEQDSETWYEDNLKNLGTKWDFKANDDSNIEIQEESIDIIVWTAWSPPINFLHNLCKKFGVQATIIYEEPGCDFCGKTDIDEDGNINDDCCGYHEGLYKYSENFWSAVQDDAEWNHAEYTEEEFVARYPFVEEKEIQDIRDLYHKAKENAEKETE